MNNETRQLMLIIDNTAEYHFTLQRYLSTGITDKAQSYITWVWDQLVRPETLTDFALQFIDTPDFSGLAEDYMDAYREDRRRA